VRIIAILASRALAPVAGVLGRRWPRRQARLTVRFIAVRPGKQGHMTDKPTHQPLSHDELNALAGEELPERAAMSLINANVAAPVNLAAALNVASDNSVAVANAEQSATIDQSN
jgi:hypothetical protein